MQEAILELPGRRLRYLIGGDGPPLVLCHGFLGSAENFETWFEELSARRTLVVPDLPGCGASSPVPVPVPVPVPANAATVAVTGASERAIAPGFLGLSLENTAILPYAGGDAKKQAEADKAKIQGIIDGFKTKATQWQADITALPGKAKALPAKFAALK